LALVGSETKDTAPELRAYTLNDDRPVKPGAPPRAFSFYIAAVAIYFIVDLTGLFKDIRLTPPLSQIYSVYARYADALLRPLNDWAAPLGLHISGWERNWIVAWALLSFATLRAEQKSAVRHGEQRFFASWSDMLISFVCSLAALLATALIAPDLLTGPLYLLGAYLRLLYLFRRVVLKSEDEEVVSRFTVRGRDLSRQIAIELLWLMGWFGLTLAGIYGYMSLSETA